MTRLNALGGALVRWVYPADRPSLLPFVVRRALVDVALQGLLMAYKLGRWLERGIGVVDPDGAKRNGIKKGHE